MMLAGQQKLGGVEGAAGAARARQVEGVRAPIHTAAQRRAPHAAVRAPAITGNTSYSGKYCMPVAVLVLLDGMDCRAGCKWNEAAGVNSPG